MGSLAGHGQKLLAWLRNEFAGDWSKAVWYRVLICCVSWYGAVLVLAAPPLDLSKSLLCTVFAIVGGIHLRPVLNEAISELRDHLSSFNPRS